MCVYLRQSVSPWLLSGQIYRVHNSYHTTYTMAVTSLHLRDTEMNLQSGDTAPDAHGSLDSPQHG